MVTDRDPNLLSLELGPPLRYPEGWREILEAPDAADYQVWMRELTNLTRERLRETGVEVGEPAVTSRWQRAIELVADAAIDPDDLTTMSEAEILETALLDF